MAADSKAKGASSIWTYSEAKQKCSEKHSGFVEIETREHMRLSPYYIGRIKEGIEEQIEYKIQRWKFLDEYGGILVAYDNIKLFQRTASIDQDSAFLHFDIQVNYIVFKPEVGKKLIGVVNKTSSSHVGCLVHGRFNASLAKPDSRKNGWIGSNLVIGTKFVFRVSEIRTVAGILSIAGHLREKDIKHFKNVNSTGPSASEDNSLSSELNVKSESNAVKNHKQKKSKSKRKHDETKADTKLNTLEKKKIKDELPNGLTDSSSLTLEWGSEITNTSAKKHKKRKKDV